ncbi:NifB/NifX family molybdenum-iron cluster-binding protein [Saccharicrinis sp. FJH2]|uniref:NifB/NifX family molybdenum-iron cluster-binding protein n=1 Tax=unclassified Saccharicrinis TaxID=2646859 RepID=UPI0035D3F6EB
MKVIIPVVDTERSRNVLAKSFHNAEFASVYDTDSRMVEWIETSSISEDVGNISIGLKKMGIYAVISQQMPPMALGLFVESGINVYRAEGDDLQENILYFIDEELELFSSQMAFETTPSCGSSCNSCSSTSCEI